VLQASALDCGPAALASLLAGFELGCPFGELRDACRTGRDGTSIDTLETVAGERGLDAEQLVVPADYLALPEAGCLPCILVVLLPGGGAHFVTLWRLHGRRAQVMDPAGGRRWPRVAALARELYRHRAVVPAEAWRAWAGAGGLLRPLGARLGGLGIGAADRRRLIEAARAAAGWRPLAALDAGARFTHQLAGGGGVRRGRDALRLLAGLVERAADPAAGDAGAVLPAGCWCVRPAPAGSGGEERLRFEGAVLVRVRGRRPGSARTRRSQAAAFRCSRAAAPAATEPRCRRAAGDRRRPADGRPAYPPISELPADGRPTYPSIPEPPALPASGATQHAVLVLATAGAALGRLGEGALLAAALELLPAIPSRVLRLAALGGLATLAAAVLSFELIAARAALALGRRRETGLRLRLAAKLPRLPDRYLRTRLLGDLAERAHVLGRVRRGPELAAGALGAGLDAALAAAGIAWLDPGLALAALGAGAAALAGPLLLLPRFEERSRRVRSHGAALAGLYLDVLRGLAAIRAHGAGEALRRRHDELLAGWLRARRDAAGAAAWLETGTQALVSLAAAGLVLAHVRRHGLGGDAIVLALWASQLLAGSQRLAMLAGRELPLHRSLLRRIEEPLAASEEDGAVQPGRAEPAGQRPAADRPAAREAEAGRARAPARPGVAIAFQQVKVEADGHPLLRDLELAIPAGQHVAVVGRSGAGKSSLFATLLGWHPPASGRLLVDGLPLDGPRLRELRRATAWAAPEVSLWRSTLLDNVCYGADAEDGASAVDGAGGAGGTDAADAKDAKDKAGAEVAAGGVDAAALAPVEALRAALLLELVPALPHRLQTRLGEGGGRLSAGEGQRLRFARALLRPGARLVLLDEPFRGLGADQRGQLLAAARRRWRDATLLCVTHSPAEAAGFDRLLVIEEGRLVEDGAPPALAARSGSRYRALLEAERAAAAPLAAPGWRRLHLAAGRLQEVATLPAARLLGPAAAREAAATAVGAALSESVAEHETPMGLGAARPARELRRAAEEGRSAEERGAAAADSLLAALHLPARRRRRARRAMIAAHLAAEAGATVVPPAPVDGGSSRCAGLLPLAAALAMALVASHALFLVAWYVLGRGLLSGRLEAAWLLAWALLLLTLPAARAAELGAAAALGRRAARLLRQRFLGALLALAPERLRGEGTGLFLGRLLAAESVESALLASGPAACGALLELAGGAAALANGTAATAQLLLLAAGLAGAALLFAGYPGRLRTCTAARRELTGRLVEEMGGHRTRLAQAASWHAPAGDDRLAAYHQALRRLGRSEVALRVGAPRAWLLAGLVGLAPAAARGSATPGRLGASLAGAFLVQAGLRRLAAALCSLAAAGVEARELLPFLRGEGRREGSGDERPEPGGTTPWPAAEGRAALRAALREGPLLLEGADLACRRAGSHRPLFSGVSFTLRAGDRVLLDGPSGAGKSTLAAMLAGDRAPDSGLLLLGGLDLPTLGMQAWRRRVVSVPQLHANHLFADTLAFNLLAGRGWPPAARDLADAEAVCRELGLGTLLDRLPAGLEQRIGEAGWQLSDGEASRVCMARALLQDPDLIVLDESLAALDPETRLRALEVAARRARTLVLIAHAGAGLSSPIHSSPRQPAAETSGFEPSPTLRGPTSRDESRGGGAGAEASAPRSPG
jgi:ABC-type multidrug transport system fused ATPase/permease subunit